MATLKRGNTVLNCPECPPPRKNGAPHFPFIINPSFNKTKKNYENCSVKTKLSDYFKVIGSKF